MKPVEFCEPGKYYPDPENCNAYYRCLLGELVKQYCLGGLHWNPETNVCDWPESAKCDKETFIQPDPSTTMSTPDSNEWGVSSTTETDDWWLTTTTRRPEEWWTNSPQTTERPMWTTEAVRPPMTTVRSYN
ncbi:UNVERIFIED_CONTAM: hypothetical protein PYX00_010248 [Menopon gallinae]|uniref:Chitin-binding type-2 domain-containing protein n=1 Tax=Menopon gallinae TaxID=328185 RepID=A0AAW2HED7_9NEOP